MRLRTRLSLSMWLPVLALGTSIALALGLVTVRIADLRADQSATLALSLEEQRFRGFLAGRLALLRAWVRTGEVQSADPVRVTAFLAGEEVAFERLFEHLYFDTPDGTVYPTRGPSFSVADRAYFPAIARGEDVVSQPFVSRDTGKRVLLVAVPVRSPTGELLGALAGTVDTEDLFSGLGQRVGVDEPGLSVVLFERDAGALADPIPVFAERLRAFMPELTAGVRGVALPGEGPSMRVWSTPLSQPGWVLIATRPEADVYETARHLQLIILGLLGVTLLGTLLGARALASRWSRSLGLLSGALRRYGAGDPAVRVPSLGADEVGELGRAFNEMADRLEASEAARRRLEGQLANSQRLESIGRLAGGVAHDYNNLLTIIINLGELVDAGLGPQHRLSPDVKGILDAAHRSAALTRQLLTIARQQDNQPKELVFDAGLADMRALLERLLPAGLTLAWQPGAGDARVRIDPTHLLQLVMNLVVNARDALGGAGTITVSTRALPTEVELRVADTGPGVPPAVREHLFEPFVTTKAEGRGTGLGLATCYGLVTQAGGRIELAAGVAAGATFVVTLPRLASA